MNPPHHPWTLVSQWNEISGAGIRRRGLVNRPLRMHALVGSSNGGGKPALMLLPGLVVSSRNAAPTALRLLDAFSVYALDLPGFGKSDKPQHTLSVPELATAVLAWMDAAGLPDAHLVGNSFGCQVIAEAASRAPQRFHSLVLTGPALDPAIRSVWPPVWRLLWDSFYEPLLVGPVFYDYWRMHPARVWRTFRACLADRIEDKLPRLTMPTLLVRGERDPIARPEWLERMALLLPDARIRSVPRAPHALIFSAPEETARLAGEFCMACHEGKNPWPAPTAIHKGGGMG